MLRKRLIALSVCALLALSAGLYAAMSRPELAGRMIARLARIGPEVRQAIIPPPDQLSRRLSRAGLSLGQPAFVRIFKQEAELEIWLETGGRYRLFRSYPICRFSGRLGPKLKEGDRQAPEGFYAVGRKQLNPYSRHHLAFNIGFPNAYDLAHGRTGSYLMVHGGCSSIGCYAMTDEAVDDIYRILEAALDAGMDDVPVHVFPFRMTSERLARAANQSWIGFWRNLKTGYDLFETSGQPPPAFVCGKSYRFAQGDGTCQPIAGW